MRRKVATGALILATVLSGMELGGGFYEGVVVYPVWSSSSPPESYSLIQEPGGLQLAAFWLLLHVLLTLALVPALVLNWRALLRRRLILAGTALYVLMRAATFAFFLPELAQFLNTLPEGSFSPELAARAGLWETLSWVRLGMVAALTILLLMATAMPFEKGEIR